MPFEVELSESAAESLAVVKGHSIDALCFLENHISETLAKNPSEHGFKAHYPYPITPGGRVSEVEFEDDEIWALFAILFELRSNNLMYVSLIGYRIYRQK